jgi:L-amino acid N-acyltransferase YncA
MSDVKIRMADPERDAAACAAIYAPYVEGSPISFEETAPSAAELGARIARTLPAHPWLVAEEGGEVVGYAYACPHRERPAYRWSADVSIYLDGQARGRGTGRALYAELFERLRAQGVRMVCAGITLPNPASIGLHEHMGFEQAGFFPRIGWKEGAWRDIGWWTMDLAPDADSTPAEPRPPEPEVRPG